MCLCRLSKRIDENTRIDTHSWIPIKYAKKNLVLKLLNESTNEYEGGWVVMDTSDPMDRSMRYKNELPSLPYE